MIISIGLRMTVRGATLTQRNLTIIAVSLVIGVGVEWRSDALAQLPSEAQVLATSGLIMGGVTALVLNAVLPEDGDSGTPSVMGDPIAEDDD
jgi:xanthine/uracil permease